MNASVSRPHDPYIPITPRYWPPYIELLLRSVCWHIHRVKWDRNGYHDHIFRVSKQNAVSLSSEFIVAPFLSWFRSGNRVDASAAQGPNQACWIPSLTLLLFWWLFTIRSLRSSARIFFDTKTLMARESPEQVVTSKCWAPISRWLCRQMSIVAVTITEERKSTEKRS
jgi:hypothetical protein